MDSPLCQSCAGRPELRPIILLYFDRDDGNASIGAAFEFWQPVLGNAKLLGAATTGIMLPLRLRTHLAMAERRSQFGYEDLLACGRGELFGVRECAASASTDANVRSHCGNYRSRWRTWQGVRSRLNSILSRTCGFSTATSKATRSCRVALAWMLCGN